MITRLAATGLALLVLLFAALSLPAGRVAADDDPLNIGPLEVVVSVPTVGVPEVPPPDSLFSSTAPDGVTISPIIEPVYGEIAPSLLPGDTKAPVIAPWLRPPNTPETVEADRFPVIAPTAADLRSDRAGALGHAGERLRCLRQQRAEAVLAVISASGLAVGPASPAGYPGSDQGGGILRQAIDPFETSALRDSVLAILGAALATAVVRSWLRFQQRQEARLIAETGSPFETLPDEDSWRDQRTPKSTG